MSFVLAFSARASKPSTGVNNTAEVAQPPQHLRQQDRPEPGDRAFQDEPGADQKVTNDHRETAAVHICHHTGWHLEQEDRQLQDRAYQHQLQRGQVCLAHLVQRAGGKDHGKDQRARTFQDQIYPIRFHSAGSGPAAGWAACSYA